MSVRPVCVPCGKPSRLSSVLQVGYNRFKTDVKLRLTSDTDCSICLNPIITADSDARIELLDDTDLELAARPIEVLGACGHVFHRMCLSDALRDRPAEELLCPIDRVAINAADLVHIQNTNDAAETTARVQELTAIRARMRQSTADRAAQAIELESRRRADAARDRRELDDGGNDDDDFYDRLEQMRLEFDAEDAKRKKKNEKRKASKARKTERVTHAAARATQVLNTMKLTELSDRWSMLWFGFVARTSAGHQMKLLGVRSATNITGPGSNDGDVEFEGQPDGSIDVTSDVAGYRRTILKLESIVDTPRATVFVGGLSAPDKRAVEDLSLLVLKSMSSLARTGFLVTFDAPTSIDPATRLPLPIKSGFFPMALYDFQNISLSMERVNDLLENVSGGLPFVDALRGNEKLTKFGLPLVNVSGGRWVQPFLGTTGYIDFEQAKVEIVPFRTASDLAMLGDGDALRQVIDDDASSARTLRIQLLNGVFGDLLVTSGSQMAKLSTDGVVVASVKLPAEGGILTTVNVLRSAFASEGRLRAVVELARELRNVLETHVLILPTAGQSWLAGRVNDISIPFETEVPLPLSLGFIPAAVGHITHSSPKQFQATRVQIFDRLRAGKTLKTSVEEVGALIGLRKPTHPSPEAYLMFSSELGTKINLVWSLAPVQFVAGA